MSTRLLSLRRGKTGTVQNFSLARGADPPGVALLAETLRPTINSARRAQILGDVTNVHQFACVFGGTLGFLTRPQIVTLEGGDTVVLGNFTDTIGEPVPVSVPLGAFQGFFTTLVRAGDAREFNLATHPTAPDTIAGPPAPGALGPIRGAPPPPVEASLARLNFALPDEAVADDHPVIAALPCFLPIGPGQTFPHLLPLADPQTFRESFPLFEVWKRGVAYAVAQSDGLSVTLGTVLFHEPGLELGDGEPDPFEAFTIRLRVPRTPELLGPTHALYRDGRALLLTWSDTVWTELGANMPAEAPPPPGGGGQAFTPEQFAAAMAPVVNKDKTFSAAGRTAARYRLLCAALPQSGSTTPDRMVLPDLKEEFKTYLAIASSATAGDDLKELVKSQLNVANSAGTSLDKDVTLEPGNITLAFSDRIRTFTWLVERLVTTSLAGAQASCTMLKASVKVFRIL